MKLKEKQVAWTFAVVLAVIVIWLLLRKLRGDTIINNKGAGFSIGGVEFGPLNWTFDLGDWSMPDITVTRNVVTNGPVQFNFGGLTNTSNGVSCSSCNTENTRRLFPWIDETFQTLVNYYEGRAKRAY